MPGACRWPLQRARRRRGCSPPSRSPVVVWLGHCCFFAILGLERSVAPPAHIHPIHQKSASKKYARLTLSPRDSSTTEKVTGSIMRMLTPRCGWLTCALFIYWVGMGILGKNGWVCGRNLFIIYWVGVLGGMGMCYWRKQALRATHSTNTQSTNIFTPHKAQSARPPPANE